MLQIADLVKLAVPVAWLVAPLFDPVLAVTVTFLASELLVVMQISTIPSGSVTFLIGGSMLNSGTACKWEIINEGTCH